MRITPYDAYEPTDLNWIGDLPSHWQASRLGKFFEERREKVSDKDFSALSVTKNGIVPQLENAAKTDAGDNRKKVCVGDFVINSRSDRKGSSGVSSLAGSVSLISIVLEPKSINNQFIHHLFRSYSFQEEFYRWGKGIVADLWSTNYSAMKNITIPVPQLEEQQAIATFLDHETARIDTLIEKQQKLIALLKEKRQAVISHTVTKGLDLTTPMKDSGVEWLGEVPTNWNVVKFAHVAIVVRGGSPRPAGDSRFFNGNFIPWVTVAEVTKDEEIYLTQTATCLTKEGGLRSRLFEKGTLVLTNSGATLGVPKIMAMDGCGNDGIVGFETLSDRINIKFAYYFLTSLTHILREEVKQGAGQPNLNTDIIKAISLPLPPLHEQLAIINYIEDVLEKLSRLRSKANDAVTLLYERRTALISAAVTGKIDVRNHPSARAVA